MIFNSETQRMAQRLLRLEWRATVGLVIRALPSFFAWGLILRWFFKL